MRSTTHFLHNCNYRQSQRSDSNLLDQNLYLSYIKDFYLLRRNLLSKCFVPYVSLVHQHFNEMYLQR